MEETVKIPESMAEQYWQRFISYWTYTGSFDLFIDDRVAFLLVDFILFVFEGWAEEIGEEVQNRQEYGTKWKLWLS